MRPRQPLPRLWLMTDERLGQGLLPAIERLPPGSGIVFRHYTLTLRQRRALFEKVRMAALARGHLLLFAGSAKKAQDWGADGSHGPGRGNGNLRSAPVHDYRELRAAERDKSDFIFLSPVFPTRSHEHASTLGVAKFAWLARRTVLPVIALGGMNSERGRRLASFGAYGWAGIDAWSVEEDAS